MLPVTYYLRQEKEKIVDIIEKSLKIALANYVTKITFYYCGHGYATNGDWVCYPDKAGATSTQDYFNVDDLLNLVDSSDYDKSIEITTESCFSGNMCKKAKDWIERRQANRCKKGHDLKHYTENPYKNEQAQDKYKKEEPLKCKTCKKVINVEHIDGIYHCKEVTKGCKDEVYHKDCHSANL